MSWDIIMCLYKLNLTVENTTLPIKLTTAVRNTLTFSHNISSYDTILWYWCSPGDTALILIAYMYYKDPTVEQPFVDRFNVSGDGEKEALLHLLDLRPEDRGVYFGAARHTVTERVTVWYKNLLNDSTDKHTSAGNL
uniref:Uncharacterized protein n=1 Tax=Gouania willdenowi TaxID=441366 RepID=A0A8C5DSZ3_GOUWI